MTGVQQQAAGTQVAGTAAGEESLTARGGEQPNGTRSAVPSMPVQHHRLGGGRRSAISPSQPQPTAGAGRVEVSRQNSN